MSSAKLSSIYNPDNQSQDELISGFVIRTKEFNKIRRDILECDLEDSPQHYLVEGQRGMGKTSLLLRIQYELEANTEADHLLPIRLPEEQYSIFDLCRLWEHIAEYLDDHPDFENTSQHLDEISGDPDYASICFDALHKVLIKNNTRLVLLLDNFGVMLQKLTDIDQKRLRDIFHTTRHIQLIAATAHSLEASYKYDQPFYEFFKIERLEGLTEPETIRLLTALDRAQNDKNTINVAVAQDPERIETLRRLTGGVPRTMLLLYEILIDDTGNVFDDLEFVLDKVTPLYKHRMDDLPTQQQAIVDAIALNWDGITSKEISQKLKGRGMDSKKASSQLKFLAKSGLVIAKPINKKDNIYFLQERFFNIWYLMRYGRKKNRTQVHWLTRFLEEWCTPEDVKQKIRNHIKLARRNEIHERGGYYMAEALSQITEDHGLRIELIKETKSHLEKIKSPFANHLELDTSSSFSEIARLLNEDNTTSAKALIDALSHDCAQPEIDMLTASYYFAEGEIGESIKHFHKAAEKGHTGAMYNLGYLYDEELKDYDKAKHYYELAVDKGHTGAMYNLGCLYDEELKDYDKAKHYYELAVDKGHTSAMYSLGYLYYRQAIQRTLALELAEKIEAEDALDESLHTIASVFLWNDDFDRSLKHIRQWLSLNLVDQHLDGAIDYFLLLLAKDQTHSCSQLFQEHPELKDKLRPVYFSLMYLMRDTFPKEYLKAGAELDQTIDEILRKIDEMKIRYN
ncbi:MAG: tetratricopeptide repeat protein [Gammaproteobacteria bacterium]|nr:tetratricopeptide repeat protein [Gammaproteobacteria bacterium]